MNKYEVYNGDSFLGFYKAKDPEEATRLAAKDTGLKAFDLDSFDVRAIEQE